MLLSDNDTALEVLATQDSFDFSLADMQDIHPIIAFLLPVPSTSNS